MLAVTLLPLIDRQGGNEKWLFALNATGPAIQWNYFCILQTPRTINVVRALCGLLLDVVQGRVFCKAACDVESSSQRQLYVLSDKAAFCHESSKKGLG